MIQTDKRYEAYIRILKKELVPAMGCTEPIAIAYGAATARAYLEMMPQKVRICASGNIIKNVKSVVVPHTGGMKGLEAAAGVGVLYGNSQSKLEVLSQVTEEQIRRLPEEMKGIAFSVEPLESTHVLDLKIEVSAQGKTVMVHIVDEHTNIVEIVKDGETLLGKKSDKEDDRTKQMQNCDNANMRSDDCREKNYVRSEDSKNSDYALLQVEGIVDFAESVKLSDVKDIMERQINYNTAIAKEGLQGSYGARIGQVLLKQDETVRTRAKAVAAAGSDARMNGCELPVIINSGSGNQGLTASLPVIVYAKHFEKSEEELYRALLVSNLITLHLKSGIGRLSAYCGAVSAGVGAGAGIAYLLTKDLKVINHTIVNSIAIASGIVCDGAKASCAAKIAMSVEAGILGFEMYQAGSQFYDGEGLVKKGVENTIANISALGQEGMKETDKKIIEIMTS